MKTRSPDEKIVYLWDQYLAALLQCGAMPVVLPVTLEKALIQNMAERCDGFLLAGGNFDVPPELYGQQPKPWLGPVKRDRSQSELLLLREAAKRDLPVLGICGGMQTINVAFGGTLYQDIGEERQGSRLHQQKARADKTSHWVTVYPKTMLHTLMGDKTTREPLRIRVNSTHHQAVCDVAATLVVNARAADGIVEGVESPDHRFLMGVQWHPELLFNRFDRHKSIFNAFVKAAKRRHKNAAPKRRSPRHGT